jgi:hypothetical protein
VRGENVASATRKVGLDRSTFYDWLKSNPVFVSELNRAEREKIDSMRAQLRELADVAMATLKQMLTGTNVSPAVQLRAAITVLEATGALEPEPLGQDRPAQNRIRPACRNDALVVGTAFNDTAAVRPPFGGYRSGILDP